MASLVFTACTLVLLCWPALGAHLSGKVTDSGGAMASGVQLLVVNLATHEEIPVKTDEGGLFDLELREGTYAVYLIGPGQKRLKTRLTLKPDEKRRLEIQLDKDDEAGPEALAADAAAPTYPESRGTQQGPESPALATIRDYELPILELRQSPGATGRPLGEIVNVFSVRKGERFRGSVYWYHRNDNMDARNFFDPLRAPLPEFKRNQFGVTGGIPLGRKLNLLATYEGLRIIQGSTLLSHVPTAAFKQGDLGALGKPLRDPLTGQPLAGNRIPNERIHPVARRVLPLLPDANRDESDRNFVNNQPLVSDRNNVALRGDYRLDSKSKLVVSYDLADGDSFSVDPLPAFGANRKERSQSLLLSYTRNVTNRLVIDGQFHGRRSVNALLSVNAGQRGLVESLGIAGISAEDAAAEGYPDFQISGYASPGDERSPNTSVGNNFMAGASLSYSRRAHVYKAGGEVEFSQINNHRSGGLRRGRFSFNGFYSGDAFADFLFGLPDTATRAVGSERSDLRSRRWEFFFQDTWKISPKFTLTLGISHQYLSPTYSIHNNVATFHPLLFEPPADGEMVVIGSQRARELGYNLRGTTVFPDRNDWAPTVGLAYSPRGNNRLVVRTSYNVYYSPLRSDQYARWYGRNYPFYYTESAQSPVNVPQLDLSSPFAAVLPAEVTVMALESNLRTAYLHSWYLGIENEIWKNWIVVVGYRGGAGSHQARLMPGNIPFPGPGPIQPRRPSPRFGRFSLGTGSGSILRNSLEINFERRLVRGIAVKSGFTWERALTDANSSGNPSNPRNVKAERAPTGAPSRRLFLNYIVDLPFGRGRALGSKATGWLMRLIDGWRLSGITAMDDGDYITVLLPGDVNNDGATGDRPDRVGPGVLPAAGRSIDKWFEVKHFVRPAPYRFGNAGRNILRAPGSHNWDLSLIKRTDFSEDHILELRIQFFNAFNHPNFGRPNTTLGTSVFGKIFGAERAREIEVAIKYTF